LLLALGMHGIFSFVLELRLLFTFLLFM
jgi:hypothetical protein